MIIKKIIAKEVKNSRGEKTIQVLIKTPKANFFASSPSGKSIGKYEVNPYNKSLIHDINFINNLNVNKINNLFKTKLKNKPNNFSLKVEDIFTLLKNLESLIKNKLGGNSLFALESSLLKALAKENNKQLFEFLYGKKIKNIKIRLIGNAIGGGLHSKGINNQKPDYQEFLFIPKEKTIKENAEVNDTVYKLSRKVLKARKRNDENALETNFNNEQILEIMNGIKNKYKKNIDIGIDLASSSFYKNGKYYYKNPTTKFNSKEQINYVNKLIKKYNLFYIEDPLNENDFSGFSKLLKQVRKTDNCLIVGDDLTATNPKRLKKAIKNKSINAVIVKPNQIGSLLKVKEVIEVAKKHNIKTIISHRSGETFDNTIADLAVAFEADFIKTGIYGKERKSKLNRLIEIEKMLKKKI